MSKLVLSKEEIEEIKKKPTPRYGAVVKELKWVQNRIIEFVILTDEQVIFKAQIDYRMSTSDKPRVRRSYIAYFTDIISGLHISTIFPEDNTKEQNIQLEKIEKSMVAYAAIKHCIIDNLVPSYRNQNLSGCVKCHHNDFAEKFTPKIPFVCRRCRKIIRIWKGNLKWSYQDGSMSKAEYEAKLKAGTPERYFTPINKLK